MHFVPQGKYSGMRTTNLNLMMQKGSWVVQMIIAHKSVILFAYLKGEIKIKVALAVELNISRSNSTKLTNDLKIILFIRIPWVSWNLMSDSDG